MSVQRIISTQQTVARSVPDKQEFEGVVVPGSWIAAEGVCQVLIGHTVPYEVGFLNDGVNQPLMPVCRLLSTQIGDQYGPVGGERVLVSDEECGWVCSFIHGPDDSSAVPSGERWILHRSAAGATSQLQQGMDSQIGGFDSGRGGFDLTGRPADVAPPIYFDSGLKLQNDGPTAGDKLGGAILGVNGALTQSQTASGARHTIDDTAQKIEAVTAGGLTMAGYDQVKQIVHSVVAGQLQTIIDGVAQKITHQASSTTKTIIDGSGAIALVVPNAGSGGKIGLGDVFENLPGASAAINQDILTTFGSNVNTFGLNNLIQFANLLHTAGTVTTPQLTTILTALVLSWIAKVGVPDGSAVVRIAS